MLLIYYIWDNNTEALPSKASQKKKFPLKLRGDSHKITPEGATITPPQPSLWLSNLVNKSPPNWFKSRGRGKEVRKNKELSLCIAQASIPRTYPRVVCFPLKSGMWTWSKQGFKSTNGIEGREAGLWNQLRLSLGKVPTKGHTLVQAIFLTTMLNFLSF